MVTFEILVDRQNQKCYDFGCLLRMQEMELLFSSVRSFFMKLAFLLALFPSVMKIWETSHWFREGDPSEYDHAKVWFDEHDELPFHGLVGSSKILMRVYFFIIPYAASALCVSFALLIPNSRPLFQSSYWKLRYRKMLNRSYELPSCCSRRLGLPKRISVGEVVWVLIFLTLNWMVFFVRVRRSLHRGARKITFLYVEDDRSIIDTWSWEAVEIWGKTFGVMAIMNLGWYLMLPIGRYSSLLQALEISWETAVKYHRWMGFYSVFIFFLHGLCYFLVWAHQGTVKENLSFCGFRKDCGDEDQNLLIRINWYGIFTFIPIIIMTIFSFEYFRRQKYEWFFYAHHSFMLAFVFICLHYSGSIIYLIPGLAVYALDKVMGLTAYSNVGNVDATLVMKDILEVNVQLARNVTYSAGQYIFLNVPEVSNSQWHPFSLTSSPSLDPNIITFHIKDLGTWTRKVIDSAKKGFLRIRLDGFYGHDCAVWQQAAQKDHAIFVGGGIGITPMMSVAFDIKVPSTFIWVVRSIQEFKIFEEKLLDISERFSDRIDIKVWITLSDSDLSPKEALDKVLEALPDVFLDGTARGEFVLESQYFFPGFILHGAFHSLVAVVTIVMALYAYVLNLDKYNNKSNPPTDDVISTYNLFQVLGFAIGTVLVFAAAKAVFRICSANAEDDEFDFSDVEMAPLSPTKSVRSTSTRSGRLSTIRSYIDLGSLGRSREDILSDMVQNRLGCRPDLAQEFKSVALENARKKSGFNIGVYACGPLKLVESVNDVCNTSKQGDDFPKGVLLDFSEEQWEW